MSSSDGTTQTGKETSKQQEGLFRRFLQWGNEVQQKPAVVCSLFPTLLVVFAYIGMNRGVDLTDTTYSLGNYMQFGSLRGDWIYATYLSNLFGHLLMGFFTDRLILLNMITRLLPLATSLAVYFTFQKRIPPVILFLGEMIALGLCWCPTVILYNYLSYLLFTAAGLLLWGWSENGKKRLLFLAGVVLGLAFLVRISNLVYCIWILFVWYHLADRPKEIAKASGICIGGYCSGIAMAFAILIVSEAGRGGWQGAIDGLGGMMQWVSGLFTSSAGDAGGYSMGAMLKAIAGGYLFGARWFLFLLAGMALGTVMFGFRKESFLWVKTILYLSGIALIFVYYFRNGVCTAKYYNNGSIFGIGTILLFVFLLLLAYIASPLCHKALLRKDKGLAFFALVALLAAPLGSNNHLYAVLNQMFLTAPVGICLLGKWIQTQERKAWYHPLRYMAIAFLGLFTIQCILFGWNYTFKDGEDGTPRNYKMECVLLRSLNGMYTSEAHGKAIADMMYKGLPQGYRQKKLLTYGNLPGLHYALGMDPALSNLWPDLDSYAYSDMESELQSLQGQSFWIITAAKMPDYTGDMQKKYSLLQDFIYNNGYEIEYRNEEFIVYGKE